MPQTHAAPRLSHENAIALLGGMTAEVVELPYVGDPLVAIAWLRFTDGRKHHTASALFAADGRMLARAEAVWVTLRVSG